jgi:hypothetical protein
MLAGTRRYARLRWAMHGGAAVGLRHAVYRWGATQALWIPPIQTRILPYPRKVKIPRQLSVLFLGGVAQPVGFLHPRKHSLPDDFLILDLLLVSGDNPSPQHCHFC